MGVYYPDSAGWQTGRLFHLKEEMTGKKYLTFWISILALFFFLGTKVWATEISAAEYRSRIQNYVALLEQSEGKLQSNESYWFNDKFPPGLVIQNGADESYLVDRDDFIRWIEEAENSPEGRDDLIAYQKTLLNQISTEANGTFQQRANWEECRSLLDKIYRGNEFSKLTKKKTPFWRKYLREFFSALADWLKKHFRFLGGIGGEWIFYASYGILLVLATLLIIWTIRLFGPVGWRWRQLRVGLPTSIQSSAEKGWRAWRDEAHNKAQQGAFREAIRFLFISVLVEGHQKGWWLYEPEATNREHLARVEGNRERLETLRKLIEIYELAWYGLRQPGQQEFQNCEHWAKSMEGLA
jgi:hypothetical protein